MDDKIKEIFDLQDKGLSRSDIANKLDYKLVSSLDRFMRKKGFQLVKGKYVQINFPKSNCINTDLNSYFKNINLNSINFKELDSKIDEKILKEYERINVNFSLDEKKILAFILLNYIFYNDKENANKENDEKKLNLVKNVRTFFEAAFKTDISALKDFLIRMDIPYNLSAFDTYNSVRSFVRQDKNINDYLYSLSVDELEELRRELSYINSFTKNFQKALRTTDD